jgi:hypothetical protein
MKQRAGGSINPESGPLAQFLRIAGKGYLGGNDRTRLRGPRRARKRAVDQCYLPIGRLRRPAAASAGSKHQRQRGGK